MSNYSILIGFVYFFQFKFPCFLLVYISIQKVSNERSTFVHLQANLVLSLSDHNNDLLPASTKFLVYVYCADSYFYLGKYRRAESLYKKSIQFRKCLLKSKGTTKPNQDGQKELASDVDLKYQIYACLVKLKNPQEALQVLQSIPGKQRTPKVTTKFPLIS